MESLLPSEVARLVFGYLDEEDCPDSAQNFLESSPHLKECLNIRKRGKRFSTKILGLTLVEILDYVSDLATIVRDHEKFIEWNNYDKGRVNSLMKILNFENGRSKSMTPIGSSTNSRSEVSVSPSKSPQEIRNSTAIIPNPTYNSIRKNFQTKKKNEQKDDSEKESQSENSETTLKFNECLRKRTNSTTSFRSLHQNESKNYEIVKTASNIENKQKECKKQIKQLNEKKDLVKKHNNLAFLENRKRILRIKRTTIQEEK